MFTDPNAVAPLGPSDHSSEINRPRRDRTGSLWLSGPMFIRPMDDAITAVAELKRLIDNNTQEMRSATISSSSSSRVPGHCSVRRNEMTDQQTKEAAVSLEASPGRPVSFPAVPSRASNRSTSSSNSAHIDSGSLHRAQ